MGRKPREFFTQPPSVSAERLLILHHEIIGWIIRYIGVEVVVWPFPEVPFPPLLVFESGFSGDRSALKCNMAGYCSGRGSLIGYPGSGAE